MIFTVSFTPAHSVLDSTKITIEFPDDIPLVENCAATSSSMDDDSSTCTGNIITFLSPFNSNRGTGYEIIVQVDSGTNP